MLSVRYAQEVPPALVEQVERHARECGLSLEALEVVGASLDFVEAFIVAAEDGRAGVWLAGLGIAASATGAAGRAADRAPA